MVHWWLLVSLWPRRQRACPIYTEILPCTQPQKGALTRSSWRPKNRPDCIFSPSPLHQAQKHIGWRGNKQAVGGWK